jgi:putative ABC transport system ATP-binding protein
MTILRESPAATAQQVARLADVTKTYPGGVHALRGVTVDFPRGTFTAVMGPSGSGKSTLLHCAAGLDRPTSGRVVLAGEDVSTLREPRLTMVRRAHVGFVFQAFNLVDALTVWDNVLLPQRLAGVRPDQAYARELLDRVGLGARAKASPGQLSGGQKQRVALAPALASRPAVIFGDEPTGALDLATGREVLGLLRRSVDELGATVVMVTHDAAAAARADRVVFLADGLLAGELHAPTTDRVAARMTELTR